MHVFIDESGSFTGFHAGSISVVGALAVPDEKLGPLKKKYAKIRARLPLEKGEVKGRLLNEKQIDAWGIVGPCLGITHLLQCKTRPPPTLR